MNKNLENRLIPYALSVLQIFIGITAALGGFGLVLDPSGAKMDVPLALLKNSPFTNYLIPGLVLLIVNGGGNVMAAIATFMRYRYAGNLAIFFGIFLTIYITIEVWVIGVQNFFQPLYFILGVVELVFGFRMSKSVKAEYQNVIESKSANLPA